MKVMVILCCILWFCTSCTFDFDEPQVCPYNVRLNYRYAGRPDAGQLAMYVDNIRQFLFDADGVLVNTWTLQGDSLEYWQGELSPGRYTLVSWGNWRYESDIVPPPQPGVTKIREQVMTSATGTPAGGYRTNTETALLRVQHIRSSRHRDFSEQDRIPDTLPRRAADNRTLGRRVLPCGRNGRIYAPYAGRALRIRFSGRLRHTAGHGRRGFHIPFHRQPSDVAPDPGGNELQ